MKARQILQPWKGDKRYTEIAKQANRLKKSGNSVEQIVEALEAQFGKPVELQELLETPKPFQVFGTIGDGIEQSAQAQLELALRLPIAVRGALMPDTHPGYALPIGGVFAAHQAVAPAMVGVDIGCRMHLTILDLEPAELLARRNALFADLQETTVFGAGGTRPRQADHEILDEEHWQLTNQTRDLRKKAAAQLGTSGSGNHFAELIVGEILPDTELPPELQALAGKAFSGLLTHSGSRGVGYAIANNYMRIASSETAKIAKVPRMYEWLSLEHEAGQEYWAAMQLAGNFAQACHEVIHESFIRRTKLKALATIQNHHNFAWQHNDTIIHRKGATPADQGQLGIIPGSMGSASYLVQGLGNNEALWSASHGAGRHSSRNKARGNISLNEVKRWMKAQDILVEGLSVDESPQAYKDIEQVMRIQIDAGLVRPLARMQPVAVIMSGERGDE